MKRAGAARKPGRTQRTDGEATYNRILDVAGGLFASHGFGETSSKTIALQAGVDLASINYHFGSRNGLYRAALVEAHRRLVSVETLIELDASGLSARKQLKVLIGGLVASATTNKGWQARLLSREFLAPSSHLRVLQETEIPAKLPFVLAILSAISEIPVTDPALLRCLVSVMAPCATLLILAPGLSPFADQLHETPPDVLVDHLYSFAIGGLEAMKDKHHAEQGNMEGRQDDIARAQGAILRRGLT